MGLLVALGGLVAVAPAFAQPTSTLRLNGGFSLDDAVESDDNHACVLASFTVFEVFGVVTGTDGACTVTISYTGVVPNKASAPVLKSDDGGSAKVSQQVETRIDVNIGGAECSNAFSASATPEKCKVSGSVNATEGFGSPDTVENGKVSLSCDLGENGTELSSDPDPGQIDTILAAFAGRKDVKFSSKGKLTIKTKGVPSTFNFCT
jgi:hypothetical protein